MDDIGKQDIYIKKNINNNYCTILFYLYNIKYILFYAFYVLHYTFRGYLNECENERLITLCNGKGSASFGANPLMVDIVYRDDGCSAWYGAVLQPNMAATATDGTTWLGARLLCLVRSSAFLQ